jgi:hypothetical protein
MSQLSFSERVLPTIRDIIKSKELPDNVTITLLDSIPHLKEKTTGKEFADGEIPSRCRLTLRYHAIGVYGTGRWDVFAGEGIENIRRIS